MFSNPLSLYAICNKYGPSKLQMPYLTNCMQANRFTRVSRWWTLSKWRKCIRYSQVKYAQYFKSNSFPLKMVPYVGQRRKGYLGHILTSLQKIALSQNFTESLSAINLNGVLFERRLLADTFQPTKTCF